MTDGMWLMDRRKEWSSSIMSGKGVVISHGARDPMCFSIPKMLTLTSRMVMRWDLRLPKMAINIKLIGDRKRTHGVCCGWNNEKGFGFLTVDGDSSTDIYVHQSNLSGDLTNLQEGDKVELEVNSNPFKGEKMAVRVRKIDDVDSKDRKKRKLEDNPFLDDDNKPPTKKRKTR